MTSSRGNFSDDKIAELVLETYEGLPKKGKPVIRSDGTFEWTTLAGIVLCIDGQLECVCLATGVKACSDDRLDSADGNIIHDQHAEILAIRGFNRFLLCEAMKVLQEHETTERRSVEPHRSSCRGHPLEESNQSKYVWRDDRMFKLRPECSIYMYVSEAPCGDCSMGLTALSAGDSQSSSVEGTAMSLDSQVAWQGQPSNLPRGREYFYHTGLVRTKPGRRDSPITMSKSCSDKLMLRQATSLLLGPLAQIFNPSNIYLERLIIPASQFVQEDFDRAFGQNGRLKGLELAVNGSKRALEDDVTIESKRLRSESYLEQDKMKNHSKSEPQTYSSTVISLSSYNIKFFSFGTTTLEFACSRRSNSCHKPAPQSVLWIKGEPPEAIVSGVKMGSKLGSKRFSDKGLSMVCRKKIYEMVVKVIGEETMKSLANGDTSTDSITNAPISCHRSYLQFKNNHARKQVKEQVYGILSSWIPTKQDDFTISWRGS